MNKKESLAEKNVLHTIQNYIRFRKFKMRQVLGDANRNDVLTMVMANDK